MNQNWANEASRLRCHKARVFKMAWFDPVPPELIPNDEFNFAMKTSLDLGASFRTRSPRRPPLPTRSPKVHFLGIKAVSQPMTSVEEFIRGDGKPVRQQVCAAEWNSCTNSS